MKHIILVLTLLLHLLANMVSAESAKKVIVALSAAYPPFEFIKDEKIVGFDVDLVKLIAKTNGYEVKIQDMNFDSIISSLQTGRADLGISAMTITPERLKNIDFSIKYYIPKLAMLYKAKAPIKSLADLQGKIIATQLGTTMESFLKEQLAKGSKFDLVVWRKKSYNGKRT